MIYINAKPAIEKLRLAAEDLDARQFSIATSRAINETILLARTAGRRAVKDIYNIPQKNLTGINVNKSRPGNLVASLFASSTPIPMDAFSPVYNAPGKTITVSRRGVQKTKGLKKGAITGGGVSIEVIKGKREVIPFAFMIAGAKPRVFARGAYKSGTSYGFVRRFSRVSREGNDTPIKPLLSVTVHAAVINKKSLHGIEERVNSAFPAILERNISFIIDKVGR